MPRRRAVTAVWVLMTLGLSLGGAGGCQTQRAAGQIKAMVDQTTPEQRSQMVTGAMAFSIPLTPEQTEPIQAINLRSAQAVEDLVATDPLPGVLFLRLHLINDDREAAFEEVLTAEQLVRYQAVIEELAQTYIELRQ